MKLSIKNRLLNYLRKNSPKTFAKGQLCDLAREAVGAIK